MLIRVHAAGVNPVETYIRAGQYGVLPTLPYTPGNDATGVVQSVGSKVAQFKVQRKHRPVSDSSRLQ